MATPIYPVHAQDRLEPPGKGGAAPPTAGGNRSYKALIVFSLFLSIVALLLLLRSIELFGRSLERVASQVARLQEEQAMRQREVSTHLARLDTRLRQREEGAQGERDAGSGAPQIAKLRESIGILRELEARGVLSDTLPAVRRDLEALVRRLDRSQPTAPAPPEEHADPAARRGGGAASSQGERSGRIREAPR